MHLIRFHIFALCAGSLGTLKSDVQWEELHSTTPCHDVEGFNNYKQHLAITTEAE